MLADPQMQRIALGVIVFGAFGLLLTERLRSDVVAILVVLALAMTGILSPSQALAGFSSEPAIAVAAIFVVSGAVQQTGLSDLLGGWIGRLAGSSHARAVAVLMPSVALMSSVTHHLTTTAVMLPVTLTLARDRGLPPSKLLIPLSFAASLGTTITIIGAPAFLIANAALRDAGQPPLGIFAIAPIGLALTLLGTAVLALPGRWLLPVRPDGPDPAAFRTQVPFGAEPRLQPNAGKAAIILVLTIALAAADLWSVPIAMLAGAAAMVLFGCVTPREAYRAIDGRIVVFIAGIVPLGAAFEKTGAADLLARALQGAVGGWDATWLLLALFTVTALLTQVMSDAATTALLAPLVIPLARALGQAPEAFVVTVAMAAVASFLTPIGHHGNMLVYGPGNYRFSDFVRVGAPLTVLIAVTVVCMVQRLWP